ncbi:MAG: amidohydrolase [Oscillospiraceae bacterium]|nr:amidohydrolase [Oscillospiraceae bacterium]
MDFYSSALKLKDETIAHRRWLHQNAEVGLDMPLAKKYIKEQLAAVGIQPADCGFGVTATIGSGKPVILLRADMDALPMAEESGESFASCNNAAHTCGHDFHAAMLLTAAKLLKEKEAELKGTVKLMFQPAEETFEGSRNMIENGILENPAVDAALAFHVMPGRMPIGIYMYNSSDAMMLSADGFRIDIKGKGGHGAYPNLAVDPIQIAVQTHIALQTLISREADPEKKCILTVGKLNSGNAANIIPDSAVMEGTLRTNDTKEREMLVRRITEVAQSVAKTFGGSATVTSLSAVAPLICNKAVAEDMAAFIGELSITALTPMPNIKANASEDFAEIAAKVPSAMIYLSAGFMDDRGDFSAHNPKVRFNEDVCPIGAAAYAHCAARWLEEYGKKAP